MQAAVMILMKIPNPRQAEIRSLCLSWQVPQYVQKQNRPLTTLIVELQQAVLAEGTRLCSSIITAQTGASASNDANLRRQCLLQEPRTVLNSLQLPPPPPKAQLSDPWKPPMLHNLAAEPRRPGRAPRQLLPQRRLSMCSKPETKILEKPTAHFASTMRPMLHSLVQKASSGA